VFKHTVGVQILSSVIHDSVQILFSVKHDIGVHYASCIESLPSGRNKPSSNGNQESTVLSLQNCLIIIS